MTLRRPSPCLHGLAVAGLLACFPPLQAQGTDPAARPRAANAPAGHSPALRSTAPVTVNFVNADVEAVTRAMATMIGRQIALDPRVKGTMTLFSDQPLTVREAYLNYLSALRGLGFTIVENGGLLKVVPEAEAKLQTGTVSVGPPAIRGDQIITQIFQLSHENPNNLVAVLRPLISANNTINASPTSNALVITDYADNLQRIAKIIAALDQPAGDTDVIPLKHAVASDLAPMVQRLSDSSATPAAPGLPGAAGALTVLVDPRSNSLILRASNPAKLAIARAVVAKLDQPTQGGGPGGNIWVVYLKNADAVKLAAVLRAAFTTGGQAGGNAGGIGNLGGANATALQPSIRTAADATSAASPSTTPVAASAGPSTGGFIQADPSTNSLIITAPEPLYRQLRNVIDQLDSRRAQIYIETLIVKVDADKAADIGIQWQAISGDQNSSRNFVGGTNYTGADNIVNLTTAINNGRTGLASIAVPAGLNFGILQKVGDLWNIGALARFLETKANANILATPNMVALDNEEAKIVVGQNVPFITGSFTTNTSGSNNPFQTIERKDVGLTLRIKSQIGEGGTIRLIIYQEDSRVVPSSRTSPQGLTTDKSAIETTVVVDDGQIMVLGGLLKDEYGGSVQQVPFLGDLPGVGGLFRYDSRTRTKSNLMVFLRPMIIRNQDQLNALSVDRYDLIRAAQQGVGQPVQRVIMPINDAPVAPSAPAPPAPLGNGTVPPPLSWPEPRPNVPPAYAPPPVPAPPQ
ncbi:MAG: type II secretion system secretin GspD [Rubrivivax sp.]|nr:type II secretion system secretin GspD [Rubrivivax sp.]